MTRAALGFALLLVTGPAAARPEPRPGEAPAEAEAEPAGHEEEGGHHGPAGIELFEGSKTIIPFGAMLVNFAILATLLIVVARKPLTAFLVARHHAIKDGLEEAEALRRRAEEKYAEYGDKLASFQKEIDVLVEEYRKAGHAERARILAEAEEKAARLRREAQFLVSQEAKQIRIDLHKQTVDKAVRAAAERLRTAVTPSDQDRLGSEYLATISAEPRA